MTPDIGKQDIPASIPRTSSSPGSKIYGDTVLVEVSLVLLPVGVFDMPLQVTKLLSDG